MPATDLAHPAEERPLSIEEYKRLQEFPDDWILAGPLVEQYKQVGNAVPASFGIAIGSLVMRLINGEHIEPPAGFSYSRYRSTSDVEWKSNFSHLPSVENSRQAALF
jgi:DNA (cytosine-5)-methyltransferase 1